MGSDRAEMGPNAKPLILNIGCGFRKFEEGVNVDGFSACNPDVLWNLNEFPYPWDDNSVDYIYAYHVLEHLKDWWGAFRECVRIMKFGAQMEVRVPDASSDSALAYRDHLQLISLFSFDGVANRLGGRYMNSWAAEQDIVPAILTRYARVPFPEYNWMPIWLLKFCAKHFRNFIWEQRLLFMKIRPEWFNDKMVYIGHPKTEYLKKMRHYDPEKVKIKTNGKEKSL